MKWESTTIKRISIRELEKREWIEKYSRANLFRAIPPSITISREAGSGGTSIAKLVAKELKFSFYHKKIIELVAKHSKKRKDLISSLDEQSRNIIEETFGSLFGTRPISSATYFRNLVKVILSLTQKGKCVLLGRGGNFVVYPKNSLRVRVIAPLKTRIKNTIKLEGKTERQAKKHIENVYFNRKKFIREYFCGKDISNANYYDLVINTQNLSVEQVAEIIIRTFKKRFPGALRS